MMGVSRAEKEAIKILKEHTGAFISRRDGFVIIKIAENDKTVIIWIRQKPITREALRLFNKIISKHSYDKLVLLKLYGEADYVKYNELTIFDEIRVK